MHFKVTKAPITGWWIAAGENDEKFVNLFAGKYLKQNLNVIGYMEEKNILVKAENVFMITPEGVITSNNNFFPFEEANEKYLQFIIFSNREYNKNSEYEKRKKQMRIKNNTLKKGENSKTSLFDKRVEKVKEILKNKGRRYIAIKEFELKVV